MALLSRFFRVTGLVQGVGFRPTVYRIAIALNLKGEVFNDAQGVGIHLEGEQKALMLLNRSCDATPLPFAASIRSVSKTCLLSATRTLSSHRVGPEP